MPACFFLEFRTTVTHYAISVSVLVDLTSINGCLCHLYSRYIYYPSHSQSLFPTNEIGVLLASYTWSDDSTLFLGASDEELKERVLKDLVKIHGEHVRYCSV